ncbi:hypothetical protein DERP_000131 [Dermatophagoides pteronyssinus]|uniref:Secreted protein n=1 Tax=Dermatophagoides pteronyssinus TaxID=6956 RepID=A0ABQ8IZ93_DERPT|nr:hypothetical protein DERP_000131 [Dermatophagoides pteronyssinus]
MFDLVKIFILVLRITLSKRFCFVLPKMAKIPAIINNNNLLIHFHLNRFFILYFVREKKFKFFLNLLLPIHLSLIRNFSGTRILN